ncbi:chromosome replication/partitioning protein (plasmid) [Borrelia coriaceae]|uniref:Putative plasmid partition protein n=1 Tax=Borrelia coriaceae ATCC 43381 TaxID=1408429 RepID=W5SWL5_9SPIR|nr:chromosome replication/partitioning protein [Borrelia coriaceae]AHH11589.1 Putative plasmid partition protein [Borrelia coriaceae ATCC 43381]UPA17232.1 chromosome replication/partitioning protein [Borrelia coriaceae]
MQKNKFKLNKRVIEKDNPIKKNTHNINIQIYEKLKEKLKINLKEDIYNKIETMKILKEINDKKLFKLDGYKNFSSFIKNYNLARTQVYAYLTIAEGLKNNLIDEDSIITKGIMNTYFFLSTKETQNKPKTPKLIKLQFKNQDAYNFYKINPKFTCFLMEQIFTNKKEYIEQTKQDFEQQITKPKKQA